jgi:hypothetical protein
VAVDVASRASWAPDLVADTAQRAGAEFVALGAAPRPESRPVRLGVIHERVIRTTPCPLLTATSRAPARADRARPGAD